MAPRTLAPLVVVLIAASAAADSPAVVHPNLLSDDRGFRLDFTLDAWFPRLVGDASIGGATNSVGDRSLNDTEASFFGVARASLDRWHLQVSGFTFETDGRGASGGVDFRSEAAWWDVSIDLGYELWRPFAKRPFPWSETRDVDAGRVDIACSLSLGVSYDDFRWGVMPVTGAAERIDGGWFAVRAGAEFVLSVDVHDLVGFVRSIDIVAGGSIGPSFGASGDADGTGTLWTVDAGVHVRFSPNFGAHVGYRLIDNDFEYEGGSADLALRGLVAGLSLRF